MSEKDSEYWDEAYKKGVHWEDGRSKGAEEFSEMLKPKSSVLDIGCGSGRDCVFFAQQEFDVSGVDISEEAVKKAKQAAEKQSLKIRFEVMNAENLAYDDESFDAVYSNVALHFTQLLKPSSEIYRVLKKGGICFSTIMLNTTDLQTNETKGKYSIQRIMSAFGKFKILKQEEIEAIDDKPIPHKHKILVLILKKD